MIPFPQIWEKGVFVNNLALTEKSDSLTDGHPSISDSLFKSHFPKFGETESKWSKMDFSGRTNGRADVNSQDPSVNGA